MSRTIKLSPAPEFTGHTTRDEQFRCVPQLIAQITISSADGRVHWEDDFGNRYHAPTLIDFCATYGIDAAALIAEHRIRGCSSKLVKGAPPADWPRGEVQYAVGATGNVWVYDDIARHWRDPGLAPEALDRLRRRPGEAVWPVHGPE